MKNIRPAGYREIGIVPTVFNGIPGLTWCCRRRTWNCKKKGAVMKQCMITILFTVLFCTAAFAEEYPTVMFGSYEQDGDPENGKEPIEWLVVD